MNNEGWNAEPATGNGIYLKIEPNTQVRMRIISEHPICFTEEYPAKDGKPARKTDRWAVLAIVKTPGDNKKPVLTLHGFAFGVSIFKAIRALWQNDEWGDPRNYDITIKRDGADMDTKYAVIPAPAKPLTPEEQELIATCDLDLYKMYVKEGEYDEFA